MINIVDNDIWSMIYSNQQELDISNVISRGYVCGLHVQGPCNDNFITGPVYKRIKIPW